MQMSTPLPRSLEAAIDAYDWIPTNNLYGLVANFARAHILVTLFDGEPEKWLDFIHRFGTDEERRDDVPFLEMLKARIESEPELLAELRRVVAEVSDLFAKRPLPT